MGAINFDYDPDPSPSPYNDSTQITFNTQLKQNLVKLNLYAMSVRNGYYALTTINNGNTPMTVVRITKHNCINFEATNAALTGNLPLTGHIEGDTYMFADNANNAATYNLTVGCNGNLIDGSASNLTISANKGFILLEYVNSSVGFRTLYNSVTGIATLVTEGNLINSATSKSTPVDADMLPLMDSAAANILKKLSWANLKATLLTDLKDISGKIVGLTLMKINFRNTADTFTSYFINANTASRNYTFPDRSGTIADDTDITNARAYADSLVVGLWDDRGNYDASGNVFPSSGGSGSAGAIKKGDIWTISVAGTLGGHAVTAGDTVRALIDTPGSTDANWAIAENNIGYVAENAANKDATGGYAGLTLFKINFKNAANSFTSFLTNTNTAVRTYLFPDYDGTIATLAGTEDLTNKSIYIPSTLPVNQTGAGKKQTLTAGEALVFGSLCYQKSDGKLWKADSNGSNTFPVTHMALGTISADASGTFLLDGVARDDSWTWTISGKIYLSATAGTMTQTAPSATDDIVQLVAVAFPNATHIQFGPSKEYYSHT